jgi:hypothetical protein
MLHLSGGSVLTVNSSIPTFAGSKKSAGRLEGSSRIFGVVTTTLLLEPDEAARLVFELFLLDIHEIMQCEQSSEPQSDGYRKLLNDAQKSTYWSLTMMRHLAAISPHSL